MPELVTVAVPVDLLEALARAEAELLEADRAHELAADAGEAEALAALIVALDRVQRLRAEIGAAVFEQCCLEHAI